MRDFRAHERRYFTSSHLTGIKYKGYNEDGAQELGTGGTVHRNIDITKPTIRTSMTSKHPTDPVPEQLYHILFTQSHLNHDVYGEVEKVRVCETYGDLSAAKAAAHRCLFDAGYQREWFSEYDVKPEDFPASLPRKAGLMVYALSPDRNEFRVSIATTTNTQRLEVGSDHKVEGELYHVLQTSINYERDEEGAARETIVEGSFRSYRKAVEFARTVLLSEGDGVTKASFPVYDEAGPGEGDCGWGENVIVRAAKENGVNFLVSVVKEQEMESVRLAEAALRLR